MAEQAYRLGKWVVEPLSNTVRRGGRDDAGMACTAGWAAMLCPRLPEGQLTSVGEMPDASQSKRKARWGCRQRQIVSHPAAGQ